MRRRATAPRMSALLAVIALALTGAGSASARPAAADGPRQTDRASIM